MRPASGGPVTTNRVKDNTRLQTAKRPSDHPELPPHFPERTLLQIASRAIATPNLGDQSSTFNDPDLYVKLY